MQGGECIRIPARRKSDISIEQRKKAYLSLFKITLTRQRHSYLLFSKSYLNENTSDRIRNYISKQGKVRNSLDIDQAIKKYLQENK